VAALAVLTVLCARLGPRRIGHELVTAGPGALWLLIAYSLGTAVSALPWRLLLGEARRPALLATIASRFAASGANTLIPVLGVGGEPVRLLWLPRGDVAPGLAAIIVDRLLYAAASAIVLVAGAVAALRLARLPSVYTTIAVAGAALLLVVSLAAIWLAARHSLADRLQRLIGRLRRRAQVGGDELGERVDREIEAMLRRRGTIVVAVLIHVVGRALLGAEVYLGFVVLDVPLSVDEALAFATIPVLLGFIGAVVPSQLGIQEATQAVVAAALGIPAPAAVAVVVLQRIRQLVTMGIAWVLIATHRRAGRRAPADAASPGAPRGAVPPA